MPLQIEAYNKYFKIITEKTMAPKNKKNKSKSTLASKADKHSLYERSVQCVEAEIDFIEETYTTLRKKKAVTLREDFCGTANTSCEWIRRRKTNHAIGVDLDPEVLAWGKKNNISTLSPAQQERIVLLNDNVMAVKVDPVDIVLAMNFSYWIFKDRPSMIGYFKKVYRGLQNDGIFFLDAFGGYEATRLMEESTDCGKFTYIWDQDQYNPINGHCTYKIHYKFKDGSKLKNAFIYEWRIWTLPELTEMLIEAGFKATIYWEGTDKNNEGNGVFTPATEGEADAGWVVYIVAEK